MQLFDSFQIAAQHPCLSGHFPNHPIVPGVVLLEQVEKLIQQHLSNWTVTELNQAKFIETVLPEEQIEITVDTSKLADKGTITFELLKLQTQKRVATGKASLSQVQQD